LADFHQTPGQKSIDWEGTDDKGNAVASGIYFYKIDAGAFTDSKKMVILK
jgi:flagellar hook assembly protein FlgD